VKAKSDLPNCILIQKYTSNILQYTKGMSEQDFSDSTVTYDACVLNFINIGEQVKTLSEDFKKRYPQIPYRNIIGLRNVAAHSYEGLEPFRLFKAIHDDIPLLYEQISSILNSGDFE